MRTYSSHIRPLRVQVLTSIISAAYASDILQHILQHILPIYGKAGHTNFAFHFRYIQPKNVPQKRNAKSEQEQTKAKSRP
jgi:hypothetical protein